MKKRFSRLLLLLIGAFGLVFAGHGETYQTVIGVYALGSTMSSDEGFVRTDSGQYQTTVKTGCVVNWVATRPDGMKLTKWGFAKYPKSSAWYENFSWTDSSELTYAWTATSEQQAYVAARFDYISYTLRYQPNGGGTVPDDVKVLYTNVYALAAAPTPPTGRHFSHWTASNTFDEEFSADFAAGAAVNGQALGLASCHVDDKFVKLTATWATNTYTIAFDGNDADGGTAVASLSCRYDAPYALPNNTFTRTDHTFAGWNTKKDGKGTTYDEGAQVSNLTATDGATVTLYAQWTEVPKYTLNLHLQGGTYAGQSDDPKSIYGLVRGTTNLNVVLPAEHPDGKPFCGYWTASSGGLKIYDADGHACGNNDYWTAPWPNGTYRLNAGMTLYARWGEAPVYYTIAAQASPAVAGTVTGGGEYEKDSNVTLTATSNAGYSFSCWTNETGVVTNANPWTFNATASVTNTAVFTGNVYKVWFVDPEYGGTPSFSNKTVTYGQPYGELPTVTYKDLHVFSGWLDEDEAPVDSETVVSKAKNQYLHPAEPTTRNPKVTFVDPSGTNATQIIEAVGGQVTAPSFSRTGYWFAGWDPALPATVTADLTTYAQWTSYADVLDCPNSGLVFAVQGGWQIIENQAEAARGVSYLKLSSADNDNHIQTTVPQSGLLTFKLKGGTGTKLRVSVNGVEKQTLVAPADWETQSVYIEDAGESVIKLYCAQTELKGFCAVDWVTWTPGATPLEYTVTFRDPSGTFDNNVQQIREGQGATAPDWQSEKFDPPTCGWDKDFSAVMSDLTVNAVWTCRVTFVDAEFADLNQPETNWVGYGAAAPSAPSTWEHPGYKLVGWEPDLSGVIRSNTTFTAKWMENDKYTVTYQHGSDATGSAESQTRYREQSVILHGNGHFSRTGCSQDGWATNDLGATVYLAGAEYTKGENVTLYPAWTGNLYKVTFNAAGGSVSPGETNVVYGRSYGILPNPMRENHTFDGWFLDGTPVKADTTVTAPSNHTLVAKWTSLEVDEIARALDCAGSNLTFVAANGWTVFTNDAIKAVGGSCLSNSTKDATLTITVPTAGTLSVMWRGKSGKTIKTQLSARVDEAEAVLLGEVKANLESDWERTQDIHVDGKDSVIVFNCPSMGVYCALDHVIWTPDTPPEHPVPVEGRDNAVISSATVADGRFVLSFAATNVFDYVLKTNADLTVKSWGEMMRTNGAKTVTFEPPIQPTFPQFFYKVETVQKKD